MATLHYHGHSTISLFGEDGTRIVVDPWFSGSPVADVERSEVGKVDWIFCTHGHGDHFSDALPLARETGATLVSSHEIVEFAASQGIEKVHGMGVGGGFDFPFGRVKMTAALHGGEVVGDETGRYTCTPGGFLFHLDGVRIYHAGDTALLMDMQLLKGRVDVALLPIGDNYTMGPEDAVRAIEFIEPKVVVPIHFDTFPLVAQDTKAFIAMVGSRARVEVLRPGDRLDLAGAVG